MKTIAKVVLVLVCPVLIFASAVIVGVGAALYVGFVIWSELSN